MSNYSVLRAIKQLKRPIFTTYEVSNLCGTSLSGATQILNNMVKDEIAIKIYRGIWSIEIGEKSLSPYLLTPFLLPHHRVYLSFISALHLYGIIEQIPQTITLASISHTRTIHTKLGTFFIHRIAPSFFKGFEWYKGDGHFLIAEQEKALIDCLYLSARKKMQFGFFPELHFPESFNFNKAKKWAKDIPDSKIRISVFKKLEALLQ